MTRTIPAVVSCFCLFVLGCLLFPGRGNATFAEVMPAYAPSDTLWFSLQDCEGEVLICLDSLPLATAIDLSIRVNGSPYQRTIAGCNFDTISAYTYTTLFGQGEAGPYELTAWQVGDTTFMGQFETIPDLVDSMNFWDPLGNWTLDEAARLISGGNGSTIYSDMSVQVIAINTPSFIGYNFGMEAKGTQLSFGAGVHRLTITDTLNNTLQSAVIIATCSGQQAVDTHLLVGEQMTHCLSNDNLVMAIDTITFCTALALENIAFELTANDSCINFLGNKVGMDTICVVACDLLGFCDTTLLHLNVLPRPTIDTIEHTIKIGESLTICPEMNELSGIVTGIDDFCENNLAETIIFTVNNVALCSEITGQNLGKDSICTVICDNLLTCDTTYYIITVVSNAPSLIATPDLDTTSINSPIVLNILGNDSIPNGMLTNIALVMPDGLPQNGEVTINPDGSIFYQPNQGFCGNSDQFLYHICNETGCDTATVDIYVNCTTAMTFYSGFSPNGDGLNDFFVIDGISQFPNNELVVFNRWGAEVFRMNGYKNAWNGTWQNQQLPDGTYYYVLRVGVGKEYKGFVLISR